MTSEPNRGKVGATPERRGKGEAWATPEQNAGSKAARTTMWLACNCSPQGQPHAARIYILATEAPNTAAHQGQPHAACHRKTPNFRVSDIRP